MRHRFRTVRNGKTRKAKRGSTKMIRNGSRNRAATGQGSARRPY